MATREVVELKDGSRRFRVGESDLVFANRRGKTPFSRQAFYRAVQEAGIENLRAARRGLVVPHQHASATRSAQG